MHKKIIDVSLRYRFFVILAILAITLLGIYQYTQLPVDAFPDISPVMGELKGSNLFFFEGIRCFPTNRDSMFNS